MKTLVVLEEGIIRALLGCISREKDSWDSSTSWPELEEAERQLKASLTILAQAKAAVAETTNKKEN
jgi:hypothetical protein